MISILVRLGVDTDCIRMINGRNEFIAEEIRSMSPVVRPNVPYRGPITGGIYEGKLIEIKGAIPYGAQRFEINLLTGLDPSSDRALHLSIRFDGRVVVRNAMERGAWGIEERQGIFPFTSGRDFTMMILVEFNGYRIAVNGQHCWEFNHRIPVQRVSSIYIDGSIQVDRIEFIDKPNPYQPGIYYPSYPVVYPTSYITPGFISPGIVPGIPTNPGICPVPGIPANPGTCVIPPPEQIAPQPGYYPGKSNLSPVYNPSIPYAYPIYGGIKPGMMVYISGRPSASAHRFTVNFQNGTAPYPPPDIALHFDVRFFSHSIVRNSRTNNVWDREETIISHFPFQPAVNFDMIIRIENERYMVAINGQHFVEFRHRLHPMSRFDTLYIENDIIVSSIRFA
ncbi:galectin-4 [Nephila pilipes]|uniref:Galectin n=1 Tax=Nephila pilipes TaxID=299642 RepID=A0A8X6PRL5_NEPPI|nr:galectin-4 [Nephila pilipes]